MTVTDGPRSWQRSADGLPASAWRAAERMRAKMALRAWCTGRRLLRRRGERLWQQRTFNELLINYTKKMHAVRLDERASHVYVNSPAPPQA